VGRVGVEPTTKRLRAYLPNAENIEKSPHSPLIDQLNCTSKAPAFSQALRGNTIPRRERVPLLVWLGIFIALTIIGASAVHLVRHPPVPPVNHCPPSDLANRWCIR